MLSAVTVPSALASNARPLHVTVVPDATRTVSKTITAASGSLTAQGADGTTYTLVLPEGVLLGRETIRMTRVTRMDSLPATRLLGAVHLEPKGLEFLEPLTLRVTSREKVNALQLRALTSHALGRDVYLQPLRVVNGAMKVLLSHFSNPGGALASPTIDDHLAPLVPTDARDRLETDAARTKIDAKFMDGVYEDKVRPELNAASSNAARLKSAIKLFLAWRVLVGTGGLDDAMKARIFEG